MSIAAARISFPFPTAQANSWSGFQTFNGGIASNLLILSTDTLLANASIQGNTDWSAFSGAGSGQSVQGFSSAFTVGGGTPFDGNHYTGTMNVGYYVKAQAFTGPGGIVDRLTGFRADMDEHGTGTVAVLEGVSVQAAITGNLATIANNIGIHVQTPILGTGTITSNYGIKVENQNVGGSYTCIYTGLGGNYFTGLTVCAGGVNLGGTTLTQYQEGTFTPTFTGLTVVNGTGGVTWTGRYTRIGNRVDWTVQSLVSGTCTLASTAGTTFLNNLPFSGSSNSVASTSNINGTAQGIGQALQAGLNAFLPTFGAMNSNIVISGTIFL